MRERARRAGLFAVAAFAVLAALTACTGGSSSVAAVSASSSKATTTASPSSTPSPTVGPSSTPPTPSPSLAPIGDPVDLADGKYFVILRTVDGGETPTATFDLMYFYTGERARQAAKAAGQQPITGRWGGDIWIVNENPKLRTFAVDPGSAVTYYREYVGDPTTIVSPIHADLASLVDAMHCRGPSPIQPNPNVMNFDWWITLRDGRIVSVEEAMDIVGDPAADGPCRSATA
jgi:hypothetical protein